MRKSEEQVSYIDCQSEYGTLQKVVVCSPHYMEIVDVINDVQKKYVSQNINQSLAITQHQNFVNTLQQAGVDVIHLTPNKNFPEQVFTRDIGFALGNQMFVSAMANPIRQGEEHVLATWLDANKTDYRNITGHPIEGGDVLIDGRYVYIGISDRTSMESIQKLQNELPTYDIIPIPFKPNYLHLDCIFNVLSPTDALIFPSALDPKIVALLSKRYNLIEVPESEQFSMGTNVLSIGNNRVLSLPVNVDVNHQMRQRGYEVLEVDFSEIIKSGGSFRCCSMPLLRT